MYGINYSLLIGFTSAGSGDNSHVWISKEDATMPALRAVAEYVERQYDGEAFLAAKDGDGPGWRVRVERLIEPEAVGDE